MTTTKPMTDKELRKRLKKIDTLIKTLSDEVLVYAINAIGDELEIRSQNYMKLKENK